MQDAAGRAQGAEPAPQFVHRFLPAQAPGLPALLLLHGTGGDENDLLELGRTLLPGAALLSPRGQVLENGLARFFRRIREGVFDLVDLRIRAAQLAGFVQAASARYGLDPARITAVGYSHGANMAAALLLLAPALLEKAVLLHAMVPLVPEPLPDLRAKRVFLAAGRADRLIPAAESKRLTALLKQAGAEVELCWQPGGHGLSRVEIEAARAWLGRAS